MAKYYFPINIDLRQYPVLVVGGGRVAYRKVSSLLLFGGNITLVSPKLCPELEELHKQNAFKYIAREFLPEDVDNFKLIFCATDNKAVSELLHSLNLDNKFLLNVADVPEKCNFILPGIVHRGDAVISISTQGTAPFLVKKIKEVLEYVFPKDYAEIVELAGYFREKVMEKKNVLSEIQMNELFDFFLNFDWESVILETGFSGAREKINQIIDEKISELSNS